MTRREWKSRTDSICNVDPALSRVTEPPCRGPWLNRFDDPVAEGRHYRLLCKDLQDELADVKLALEDFQTSSKDLEEELERELAATEKRESELRAEAERLRADNDQWKVGLGRVIDPRRHVAVYAKYHPPPSQTCRTHY